MSRAREIADLVGGPTPDIILKTADGAILNLQTSDTTVTDGSVLGAINFTAPNEASGTDALLVGAVIQAEAEGTFAADNNATSIVFKTAASAAAGTASGLMTFTSGGNLIIKDTDTADGSSPIITLQTGDTDIAADDVLGSINFQAPDEGAGTDAILVAAGISAVSEGNFSSSNNATKLVFKTGASEAATDKMILASDGQLTLNGTAHTIQSTAPMLDFMETGVSNSSHRLRQNSGNFVIQKIADDKGSPLEQLELDGGNGNVEVSRGNLVIGTAGKGIDFNAQTATSASGASAAVEILSHYEQGTFTPVFINSGGVGIAAYAVQVGTYTRIGAMVHAQGRVVANGLGDFSGSILLQGLPYDQVATTNAFTVVSIGKTEGLSITAGFSLTGSLAPNTTQMRLELNDATTGHTFFQVGELTADGGFAFSVQYHAV